MSLEYVSKAKKSDLLYLILLQLPFSIGVIVISLYVLIVFEMGSMFIVVIPFLLIGISFLINIIRLTIKYIIRKVPFEFYAQRRRDILRTTIILAKGKDVGLPNSFSELTDEQNIMLESNKYTYSEMRSKNYSSSFSLRNYGNIKIRVSSLFNFFFCISIFLMYYSYVMYISNNFDFYNYIIIGITFLLLFIAMFLTFLKYKKK